MFNKPPHKEGRGVANPLACAAVAEAWQPSGRHPGILTYVRIVTHVPKITSTYSRL